MTRLGDAVRQIAVSEDVARAVAKDLGYAAHWQTLMNTMISGGIWIIEKKCPTTVA